MCFNYNPSARYMKKWGKFRKSYKPSSNKDLYGHIQNDLFTHLKYVKNQDFKYSIFFKPNLSTFLAMIWSSQQAYYRRVYYTWCCFLTRFTTVYYKPYIEYLLNSCIETKLSLFNQHIPLLKSLESYYHTTPHFETFKSDYFFYDNYDYPYLLPYKNYIFKSDFTIYGVLWTGVERLRQKKYNEYVRAHYILHQAQYAAVRTRYIVKNVIYPQQKLLPIRPNTGNWQLRLWYKFLLAAKTHKYQITVHTLQSTADSYSAPALYTLNDQLLSSYYCATKNYLHTYVWSLLDDHQKLNSHWFKGLIYIPIILNLNRAFVDYIYQFPSQSRLDIIGASHYITAHGLSSEVYNRLVYRQMAGVKQQVMGEFIIQDTIQDYFLVDSLIKSISKNKIYDKLVEQLHVYSFDSDTVNLVISNDIFNRYLITRLFSNQVRVIPLKVRVKTHSIDNDYIFEHLRDYILCGNFYKLPDYMSRVMGFMSYFHWRSYNTDGIHQAHKGRLHLKHYMTRLNVDNLLSQYLYNIYKLVLHIWDIYGVGGSVLALNEMWNYMSVNYINWLPEYSYLNFFCLFKNNKMAMSLNYYQQLYMNKPYMSLRSHVAIRRYLHNYLTIFKTLRRAPFDQARGTCIHGKNPDRLEQWLVHVNWMRIIGLTRDQLPFYLYPETKVLGEEQDGFQEKPDYLQKLIEKTYHHHVNIYTCDLFIIEKSLDSTVYPQFKPYIKIINMLYDY